MQLPDGLPADVDLTRPSAARAHDHEYTRVVHADLAEPDRDGG
ncbi:hypothetical protein [Plantactinospora alkalitolerans]|nr:hypothetical protein [Plantactinospora alkalitolerans]